MSNFWDKLKALWRPTLPFWYICIFPSLLISCEGKCCMSWIVWCAPVCNMCNMCAFMHEGGYVISGGRCISRLFDFYPKANFQHTFLFLSTKYPDFLIFIQKKIFKWLFNCYPENLQTFWFLSKSKFSTDFLFLSSKSPDFLIFIQNLIFNTFLFLSSNSPDKFYILKHIFPQRVLCYRVILHMGEHMAGCIIICQYCSAAQDH